MSFFSSDSNTSVRVQGGTFNTIKPADNSNKSMEILSSKVPQDAFHNSAKRSTSSGKCYPNTREKVLAEIKNHLIDPGSTRFVWLHGSLGSGKTAIAQSISDAFFESGKLISSFFFAPQGSPNAHTESDFISSLAYQLSTSFPNLRSHILDAIEADPLIFCRTPETMLQTLVVRPMIKLSRRADSGFQKSKYPYVVVVDGLDSCEDSRSQRHFLEILSLSLHQIPIPILFLVTSRPEPAIRASFDREPIHSMTVYTDLDHFKADDDIRIFLMRKFKDIRQEHPAKKSFPALWPTPQEIDQLVEKSDGQFLYAAMVAKYIDSSDGIPTERLTNFLNMLPNQWDGYPFTKMDELYSGILNGVRQAQPRRTGVLIDILLVLMFVEPPKAMSAAFVENLLSLTPGTVHTVLNGLNSIIHVPDDDDGAISIFHISLAEFLCDKRRSRNLCIHDGPNAENLYQIMEQFRRRNNPPVMHYTHIVTPTFSQFFRANHQTNEEQNMPDEIQSDWENMSEA